MNRKDALEAYHGYSARTSENVRTLSLGALAIVWVFRPDSVAALPQILLLAAVAAVAALASDYLQSVYGTIAWGSFHRRKERSGVSHDEDFKAPKQINWPTNALFALKVVAVCIAYVLIFVHLVRLLTIADSGPTA